MQNFLINDFEGPLDLLLHLLKQSKMEIWEIKIVEITEQYLEYINSMEELNLDVASEYLVMAFELIELKSRSLLPQKEEDKEIEEENPEEELKRRLLEYKLYKESTSKFRDLEETRVNLFTKTPENISTISDEVLVNDGTVTLEDLMNAIKNVLERQEYSKPINTKIAKKEMSVSDKILNIRETLKQHKKVSFLSLFEYFTKPYIVVTFLSILEMAKNKELIIKQEGNFGEIIIEARTGDANE